MKKVLLVILILVLLVAVSYIKTWREHDRSEALYKKGISEGTQQSAQVEREADSLRRALAANELAMADSLIKKDQAYQATIDSLSEALDDEQARTDYLASEKAETSVTDSQPAVSMHEQILTYYQSRYSSLPKDLSEYELKIALNEIREETTQKFSISLQELKEIRQRNKLSY